jgi:hypothetical protein
MAHADSTFLLFHHWPPDICSLREHAGVEGSCEHVSVEGSFQMNFKKKFEN